MKNKTIKGIMSILTAAMLAGVFALSFTACGGDSGDPPPPPPSYIVVFNKGNIVGTNNSLAGVSGTMVNQTFTIGTAQNLTSNNYSREGFTFKNWNTAADGSGTAYANGASVTDLTTTNGATINLYAQWDFAYNLGDISSGTGKIFYRNETGFTVEIVNPAENYTAYIGKGRKDTRLISESMTNHESPLTDTAAQLCFEADFGGKTDWFLPSLSELLILYSNR